LRVDLNSGKVEKEPLGEDLRVDYIGGRGINSRLLFEEVGPEVDPLSPENRLIFGTGPFSGTKAPSITRFTVTAKSPLTNILGDANAGGHFGPDLKKAGIDHIIITGKADKPVYLWIDDEKAEIKSASHLWGKTTRVTEEILKGELRDKKVRVASIGQAGEHLVRFANIIHEERSASRTGVGAVMGSKNLKAIAVRGTGKVRLDDPEKFNQLAKKLHKIMSTAKAYKGGYREAGQSAGTLITNQLGLLAIKNFQQAGEFEGIENFDPKSVIEKYYVGTIGCNNCPLSCSKQFEVKEGPYKGEKGNKTAEGAWTPYGPVCGNTYIPAIFKLNNLGNQFGLDHIEFGQMMANLMEWYERGIVSSEDLSGIEMTWGNHEAMVEMMRKVTYREGIGDVLADGIVKASKRFGKEAEKDVSHSKGMVMAGIDCRVLKGMSLNFATSTRGADHQRGMPLIEFSTIMPSMKIMEPKEVKAKFGTEEVLSHTSYKKAAVVIHYQHEKLVKDMLEFCVSVQLIPKVLTLQNLSSLYSYATGIESNEEYMMTAAERIYNVERAFNIRSGINRKDDILKGKWVTGPVPSGPHRGERLDPEKWKEMLDEYYQLRGWNLNGIPTPEKLKELGLDDVAASLKETGVA
jgi:aldehyde:ferredoxin oxidoreductase